MDLHDHGVTGRSHDPALRGYAVIYRPKVTNHCPSCGRSHWLIGRMTAQCAFCETALPLEHQFRTSGLRS